MSSNLKFAFAVVLLCRLGDATVAWGQTPPVVEKLEKVTQARAKTILRLAHPLGKYKDFSANGYRSLGRQHEVTYTIDWSGKEKGEPKDFLTKLRLTFTLDADGDIDKMSLTVPEDTCPSAPFGASGLTVKIARNLIVRQLRKLGVPEEELDRIKKLDAKGLVAVWLKYSTSKLDD